MVQVGTLLQNRYRILRQLGGGGMGAVYLAEDGRLPGRYWAIKEMSPDQLPVQDRNWAIQAFRQEAQMLAHLKHPGLTLVADYFPEHGNWYLVMEFIEGENLEARLANAPGGRLPVDEALRITHQLCEVLTYLHNQNPPVIFRDLKPSNVMLTLQGEVKLIDFGIARFFKPGQTRDTVNLGTPGYAAPEQYGKMGLQSGPRADVYSLGALLLQMVTGYDPTLTPFPLPDPRSVMRNIPPHIAAVITQATQATPDLRYGSIREMQQALFPPTYTLPPQPRPVYSLVPPPSSVSKKWLWFIGGGLVILIVFGIFYLTTVVLPSKSTSDPLSYPTTLAVATVETPTYTPIPTHTPVATAMLTRAPTYTLMPTHTPLPTHTSIATHTPTPENSGATPFSPDTVRVPAGTFIKGSSPSDIDAVVKQICPAYTDTWCRQSSFEDELLRTQVARADANTYYPSSRQGNTGEFFIDRYEVTNAAYARCVQANVCDPPERTGTNPRHTYFADTRYADYPVVYVTWYNAETYCKWIRGRLPTADEWEKAARGTEGDWWPWGTMETTVPTNYANYRPPEQIPADEKDTTIRGGNLRPIGSYPKDRSPYGVMDMAGNVMEWVSDWYGPTRREIRGGSWNTGSFTLRATGRTGREPDQVYFDVGFRCAYDTQP